MKVPPGRALPSRRLESRWHPRGPERWKEELKRGKYSPVLKEIKTDFEKAAPGVTGGEDDPASPLSSGTETAADHVEVPPGRALPRPRLLPVLEPSWNPRGPERGEDPSNREKFSQRSSHVLKELLKEMQKAERDGTTGTDRETVQKEPLQEGSSDTRPVSDGDTQAEQATGMSGADAGKITRAGDGKKLQKHVISVIAVVSAVLLTVTLLTCLPTLWMWRKHLERRRKRT
ncbi:uncharacterized protein LOC110406040, partial [Numida meleagris]|uniref:uncharacterized protein LOC110406040 n=1 Tax=Numida meleagris TaxID=8996 RepID=UPI000B3DB21C